MLSDNCPAVHWLVQTQRQGKIPSPNFGFVAWALNGNGIVGGCGVQFFVIKVVAVNQAQAIAPTHFIFASRALVAPILYSFDFFRCRRYGYEWDYCC